MSAVSRALPLSGDMTSELHSRGKKLCTIFYFATAAMTCQATLKVQSDVANVFLQQDVFHKLSFANDWPVGGETFL